MKYLRVSGDRHRGLCLHPGQWVEEEAEGKLGDHALNRHPVYSVFHDVHYEGSTEARMYWNNWSFKDSFEL